MTSRWEGVARAAEGERYAQAYAERFRALVAEGADVHGEAAYVVGLLPPPARLLDAGCGTGRVAVRLAELGYDVVGTDADPTMIAVARSEAPGLDWRVDDLTAIEDVGERFDLVLLAGNVVPLLAPGTLEAAMAGVMARLAPSGLVVAGFGLDVEHLPDGCPVTPLDDVLAAAGAAGLAQRQRLGGWGGEPWAPELGYVVLVLGPSHGPSDGPSDGMAS